MDKRYLLVPGIAGLGDRLMTLGQAIQLARVTKRTLLIDWSQESWNHDTPPKGFWFYFDLQRLPVDVQIIRGDTETYRIIDSLVSINKSVDPPPFQSNLRRQDWTIHRPTAKLHIDTTNVSLSDREVITSQAQVVVYLRYTAGPLKQIVPYLEFLTPPPERVDYKIGVHFRNTDKPHNITEIITRVKQVWKPGMSIWLATDDQAAITIFSKEFKDDVYANTPPPRPSNGGGIHHSSAAELKQVGTTKEQLNHELIHDIYRLYAATTFVPSDRSLLSTLVMELRALRR